MIRRPRPSERHTLATLNLSQHGVARHCGISSGRMSRILVGQCCAARPVRRRLQAPLAPVTFADLFQEVAA